MSEFQVESDQWVPDGHGLDEHSRRLIAEHGGVVHLRLAHREDGQRYPRSGCGDASLGQWWTGVPAEVTCSRCLRYRPSLALVNPPGLPESEG